MKESDLKSCQKTKQGKEAKKLWNHPDIVGMGFGAKEKDGELTNDPAIKLYVQKKEKDTKLLGDRVLPKKLDNVFTDIVQLAPLRARASFKQKIRPVLGGCSGAVHVPGLTYTGTLGMAVRKYGSSDSFYVLSNNHVLANVNQSNIGDPILQPGTLDGGDPNDPKDVIGKLFDYVSLQFGDPNGPIADQPVNKVDAAIAEIPFGDISREIFWVGYPKGWRKKASLQNAVAGNNGNLQVQKTGRTTAYTQGNVTDLGFDGWVNYDQGRFAFFEDQILIQPGSFSNAGDSGSIILDMEERIIGLLFAGGATHTIANHIEDVWWNISVLDFSDNPV